MNSIPPPHPSIITDYLDTWTSAVKTKSSAGRGSGKKQEFYGIKKLRELILELAVRGLLVPQDAEDEPASELLKRISSKRSLLIREGKLKNQKKLPRIADRDKPFTIPLSWEWIRLGDATNYGVCDKAEASDVDEDTWVLELEDVEKSTSRLLEKVRFRERRFRSSKNRFSPGDVIYGKLRPYLDKVLVADEPGVCTTEMIPVTPYSSISPSFLRLLMKAPYFIQHANDSTHGMNLPRMGTDLARAAMIPLAPELEQHRIVAKVDELMKLCDKLERQQEDSASTHAALVETLLSTLTAASERDAFTEVWQRIASNFDTLFNTESSIDQLKQTILQLAVMGKLVAQNLEDESAEKLFTKLRSERQRFAAYYKFRSPPAKAVDESSTPFNLPEKWKWCRLSSILNAVTDGDHLPPPKADSGIAFLTIGNITTGTLNFEQTRFVPEEYYNDLAEFRRPTSGDILYSVVGATYGRPAFVETDRPFCVQRHIAILKTSRTINAAYLMTVLRSPLIYRQATAGTTGTAQPTIPLGNLRNFLVPLAPLAEQHRIVAKVDDLMALCESLKARLNSAQATQLHLADTLVEAAIR